MAKAADNIGESLFAKLAGIQEEAKAAIDQIHERIRELTSQSDRLEEAYKASAGRYYRITAAGISKIGGQRKTRMKSEDKARYAEQLKTLLPKGKKEAVSKMSLAEKLGLEPQQTALLLKEVGAKMEGQKRDARWYL